MVLVFLSYINVMYDYIYYKLIVDLHDNEIDFSYSEVIIKTL